MQYKFRGKSKRTNQWVVGSYHYCNQKGIMRSRKWGTVMDIIEQEVQFDSHWILVHQTPEYPGWDLRETFVPHEVYPESVGMWTGLRDKNGVDIYEGDVCKHLTEYDIYQVGYTDANAAFHRKYINSFGADGCDTLKFYNATSGISLIIGNIHDNPELLTPSQKGDVNYNMKDPNAKAAEANEQATEQQAAAESAAQDAATGADSEEGSTEG